LSLLGGLLAAALEACPRWLVSPWLFLAAVARLCLSVPVLLFLTGLLLSCRSSLLVKRAGLLLLVKRARLPLLAKRARLVPLVFGWVVAGWSCLLGGGRCSWSECGTF
jgi:hypothetical protein